MLSKKILQAVLLASVSIQPLSPAFSKEGLEKAVEDFKELFPVSLAQTTLNMEVLVSHAAQFVNENSPLIWPGFKIGPLLVPMENSEEVYAYNFCPDGEAWEKISPSVGVPYYKHKNPTDLYPQLTFSPFGEYVLGKQEMFRIVLEREEGEGFDELRHAYMAHGILHAHPGEEKETESPTFPYGRKEDKLADDLAYMVHEVFHTYQHEEKETGGITFSFSHVKLEGMPTSSYTSLLLLEDQCLANFVGKKEVRFLEDYVALRKSRLETFPNHPYVAYEGYREQHEGTAEYAGLYSVELMTQDSLNTQKELISRWTTFQPLFFQAFQNKTIDSIVPLISESAYSCISGWLESDKGYFTGASVCWGLQHLGVEGWQKKVEDGVSPSEVLSEFLQNSIQNMQERAELLKKEYNLPLLSSVIEKIFETNPIDAIKKSYAALSGLTVKMISPRCGYNIMGISYSDSEGKKEYYKTPSIKMGTEEWALSTNGLPWVVRDQSNGNWEMKVNASFITLNGSFLNLTETEGQQLNFNSLVISGSGFSFSAQQEGSLEVSQDGSVLAINANAPFQEKRTPSVLSGGNEDL